MLYIVHKPNTDFGYNPKIPFTQRLLVFSKVLFTNMDDTISALLGKLFQGTSNM